MNVTRAFALGAALVTTLASAAIAADAKTVTVKMHALNGSGESGTATLTDVAGGLQVVVSIKSGPNDVPQPTHIHVGTCGNINKAPEYPLSNTVNGESTTVVKGVHLSTLEGGKYAINVHKDATHLPDYVSCGDIKA
jgi:opacity protein-like surface antigen